MDIRKAQTCHISCQACDSPMLPMDEVCAIAHTPMVTYLARHIPFEVAVRQEN